MELIATAFAIPAPTYAAFIPAGLLLNLTPGADVMFVTASALRGGTRAGIAAGLGISAGVLCHVAFATLGLAALIAAHPALFEAIRWGGIAYLLWLAWRAWTADTGPAPATGARRLAAAFARGIVTNILNPKVALFILAFLPQFADPAIGPVWRQIAVLGLVFVFFGTFVTLGYALLAGRLAARLGGGSRLMNRLSAVLFAAIAARMASQ